jgi:hypothetical protein
VSTTTPDFSERERSSEPPAPAGSSRQLLVRLALAAGLTALAVALGVVLTRPPMTVIASDNVPATLAVASISHPTVACQAGGSVPQGTEQIRVSLSANTGPQVNLEVFSGSTLVTTGERDAGWGIDETVTVPVKRVAQTIPHARICTTIGPVVEPLQINGTRVKIPNSAQVTVLLRMEYLRPGHRSWLSLASSIAHDMGLAHAPSGTWVAYLLVAVMLAAVMLAVSVLCTRQLLRPTPIRPTTARPRVSRAAVGVATGRIRRTRDAAVRALRRAPRAAWTCALVASLSAACWSVITPPFQAPDEPSHFAYVQLLAESGRLPDSDSGGVSQEEELVSKALHHSEVEWHSEVKTITSPAELRELHEDLTLPLNRVGLGGAGVAASEPPLYYALATIPYHLGSGGSLLERIELVRLFSALLAGLTALFVFLFVRETLPAAPWAWTAAGLAAALTPLLGFTSGAVTPEAGLYAISAAIFFCLARAFRRGLTRRRAVAIGALTAAGFLTKLNFIGLAPGVMLGLVILAMRRGRAGQEGRPRRSFGPMALAMAISISPVCAYVASNALNHHHLLGLVSSTEQTSEGKSIFVDLSYVWEFYLPHLPGMTNYFPDLSTLRQLWFDRAVGFYGWLDTSFPTWVDNLALIPAGMMALLALRTLVTRRSALRSRIPELLVYLVMSLGLMTLIGQDYYLHHNAEGVGWAQTRYLVPLLPLAAALLALAARGAGRRLGPAVGALIVILFLAQDLFGQLLTVSRFY